MELTEGKGMMHKSIMELEKLETKIRSKKCRFHGLEDVKDAAEKAISKAAKPWVGFMVTEVDMELKVQRSRGRPGTMTEYRTVIKKRSHLEWKPEEENIDFDETCDGLFPLITNN